jgi:hypothetical protein
MTPFEALVNAELRRRGYEVLVNGWPDFCAVKQEGETTKVRFIEVKGEGDFLRPGQKKLHDVLRSVGIDVEVVYEDPNRPMVYSDSLSSESSLEPMPRKGGRPDTQYQAAFNFLRRELQEGPKSVNSLLRAAHEAYNISRPTVYRAAEGISVFRKKCGGVWVWELNPKEVTHGVD